MPQVFRLGPYVIYFWMNEGKPLEPIHIHVAQGIPSPNATKIWITRRGKCLLCNNNSKIPKKQLNAIIKVIEAQCNSVTDLWLSTFGEIRYYC
ncbi:MAG: DUF4160 domain-containing protein [Lachnospiraceae bacterium]|jgi:hypothetical protein|nr:DUF4160 domain-containing protein [Lachnospiraceae bacterium]